MLDLAYLSRLLANYPELNDSVVQAFELRGKQFDPWPHAELMGVVNLSADSWYRESVVLSVEAAVRRGVRLAAEGAALVDVGAESTLLHAATVGAKEQASMLVPVVRELSSVGVLVSVESYHPEVTRACLDAGSCVVNLTAARDTETFYQAAAEYDAGVVICYLQGADNVRSVGDFRWEEDHAGILYEYFARETERAVACGVKRLWVDPGLGFYYKNLADSAERVRYQMQTFLSAYRLRALGWPVCQALPHAFEFFEEEVRVAEPFFGFAALLAHTDLLRTHEVAKLRGVIRSMAVVS